MPQTIRDPARLEYLVGVEHKVCSALKIPRPEDWTLLRTWRFVFLGLLDSTKQNVGMSCL